MKQYHTLVFRKQSLLHIKRNTFETSMELSNGETNKINRKHEIHQKNTTNLFLRAGISGNTAFSLRSRASVSIYLERDLKLHSPG